MAVYGQDWSSYQPARPSTAGLGFAVIKATEGHTWVSPVQGEQGAHARAAGLVVGFYHFLWPGNIQTQAEYFVQKCASEPGDLLACDWEFTSAGTAASCAEKDAFLAAVKRLRPKHRVLLYCDRDFWLHRDTTSDCGDGLWIADPSHPAGHPAVQHHWTLHQYAETNGLDRDIANFSNEAALRGWARGLLAPAAAQAPEAPAPAEGSGAAPADPSIPHPSPEPDPPHESLVGKVVHEVEDAARAVEHKVSDLLHHERESSGGEQQSGNSQ